MKSKNFEQPELPYASEDDIRESDKLEVDKIVEENIEAEDSYHIVNTEFNAGEEIGINDKPIK